MRFEKGDGMGERREWRAARAAELARAAHDGKGDAR